ncbi:hypothetical protein LTR27_001328 [Elasticomyces elasticus]|nr:hypothetical protein LTR27_001328 [Elasticomyces elasticus]
MGDFYSNSAHNLVWLGDDPDSSFARALVPFQAVLEDARLAIPNSSDLPETLYDAQSRAIRFNHDPAMSVNIDNVEDIHGIYGKAWFTRLWSAVPERVHSLRGLRRAAVMWDHFDRENGRYPVARALRPYVLELFSALGDTSAHDNKDFVFGLLGFRCRYPGIERALVGVSSD